MAVRASPWPECPPNHSSAERFVCKWLRRKLGEKGDEDAICSQDGWSACEPPPLISIIWGITMSLPRWKKTGAAGCPLNCSPAQSRDADHGRMLRGSGQRCAPESRNAAARNESYPPPRKSEWRVARPAATRRSRSRTMSLASRARKLSAALMAEVCSCRAFLSAS